ncbi:MAG: activator of prop osmoprotectant transporter [Legionella sp.]|nr:MAG: activator of prop osmoprotectant transporter [Legionella sp.]
MRKQVLHPRTAAINQKQKNQSKKFRLDALHWLQMTFPAAFDNRTKIQPLNLGIMEDILAHADKAAEAGISKSKLREAVVLFTRRLDYLACLKARDLRVDLFGHPSIPVSEEEAERAAAKMKKRVEKSLKNTRKSPISAPETYGNRHSKSQGSDFSERVALYAAAPLDTQTPRAVSVTHKQARQYDPAAVARLKEKLGLSQKTEAEKI